MITKETRTCLMCPETFRVKIKDKRLTCSTRCSTIYNHSPEYKARLKVRRNIPEYKAREKARRNIPENKARLKVRQATPEYKAREKARRNIPENKAREKARQATPEYKARLKVRRNIPENKAREKARQQKLNKMRINKQYPCKVCDEIFKFNFQLKQHMEKHRV